MGKEGPISKIGPLGRQFRGVSGAGAYTPDLLSQAMKGSLIRFDPRIEIRNPVMFVVWLGMIVTLSLAIQPDLFGPTNGSHGYNAIVTLILALTLWFANFAEALAEGRGKAKAAALKQTRSGLVARRLLEGGGMESVPATKLRIGDRIRIEKNDIIPADGAVVDGTAFVNESAITGESAPVLKEPGTDMFSSVTAGTKVISDWLQVKVTANPGDSFIDRMIHLVEGAKRQKTPNEVALTALLSILTLIFLIVVAAIAPVAVYLHANINVADLVALLVALIPTTIGALLSAIGIAAIDRTMRFNVLATSGKAIEAAGDVQTLILDKTGTITTGDRQVTAFLPVDGQTEQALIQAAFLASYFDTTPEGRSVIAVGVTRGAQPVPALGKATGLDFSATTRMSGINFPDGTVIRKGAVSAVVQAAKDKFGDSPPDLEAIVQQVSRKGATPLAVSVNAAILGIVVLSDVLKPGIRERMQELRKMGIRTVMVTGDNPLTAQAIAAEAGVDDFIAEVTPEEKLAFVCKEQSEGRLVAMTGDGTNDAPALAQADVGLAMHSGTVPAKEAANLIDLDSDPTKLTDLVAIGRQMLITRGALTTFSIANDVAKYFAIIPAMFMVALPGLASLDIMGLTTPRSAVLSALIFNALIIPSLIPLALRGVRFRVEAAEALFYRNLWIYGAGGLVVPFVGIKLIDLAIAPFL
ncbi:MAG TPA: potassium-transporting ATPase subunit KdpB [Methylocystis sp.]|jgi:K+-transporting ATPase ATPase B chain